MKFASGQEPARNNLYETKIPQMTATVGVAGRKRMFSWNCVTSLRFIVMVKGTRDWDDVAEIGDDGRLALTADTDVSKPLESEFAYLYT